MSATAAATAFPVRRMVEEDVAESVLESTRENLLPLLLLSFQSLQEQQRQQQQQPVLFSNAAKVAAAILLLSAYYWSKKGKGDDDEEAGRKPKRVAVVGGGIAGVGAAYALRKAGIDAVVFEKKPKLGGNAKSFTWNVEGTKVETGLAVLAYPDQYFHSYCEMMREMNLPEGKHHELKYLVAEKNFRETSSTGKAGTTQVVFSHHYDTFTPEPWLVKDLAKWEWMVSVIKRVNAFFSPCDYKSLYRMSLLNPLNLISLKRLCYLCGISDLFWQRVFVPVHTSTFLEVEMGDVPAVMGELLADMIPLSGGQAPQMKAWPTTAYELFAKLQKEWPQGAVHTNCEVEKLAFTTLGVQVFTEDTVDDLPELFDAVIFACAAAPAQQILSRSEGGRFNSFLKWLEDYLLRNIKYTVDRDKTFERGMVHSNADAVFPPELKHQLLNEHCNYMEVDGANPESMENHFILSSWAPTASGPEVKGKLPMLVSYNCEDKLKGVKAEWTVTSRDAHPCLTMWQSAATMALWPVLQGFRDKQVYYCGSAFTPGNGHDLSLLSGFVVASELGAPYPFPHHKQGQADFDRLRGMMLGPWA